jgi:hypothetical protein
MAKDSVQGSKKEIKNIKDTDVIYVYSNSTVPYKIQYKTLKEEILKNVSSSENSILKFRYLLTKVGENSISIEPIYEQESGIFSIFSMESFFGAQIQYTGSNPTFDALIKLYPSELISGDPDYSTEVLYVKNQDPFTGPIVILKEITVDSGATVSNDVITEFTTLTRAILEIELYES